tara:strand:- start:546 stop:899 length:354 start_codon:yes stop_codon:yes gene_type:complete
MRPPFEITVDRVLAVLSCITLPGGIGIAGFNLRLCKLLAGAGMLLVEDALGGCFACFCSAVSCVPGGGAGRVSLKKKSDTKRIATESTTARIRLRFSIMTGFRLSGETLQINYWKLA